jgi:outer membrane scaffolding protein for murein synthesis (MipA/OmpV family)
MHGNDFPTDLPPGEETPGVLARIVPLCLGALLAAGPFAQAQAAPDAVPPPQLEIGLGATRTPGWLGDGQSVTHGTAWVNAEYTCRGCGRFQVNGGSLTVDPSLNWDPWVQGFASLGVMVGYHGNPSLGEDRNPRKAESAAGLDGGLQAVLSVAGAPLLLQVRKAFQADQGWILVAGSYLPVHLRQTLTLAFIPSTRWLDRRRSRLCFDADAAQGGTAYTAQEGIQDAALEAVLDWQFSGHCHFVNSASYRRLIGSAAATPLTASRVQHAYCSGVSYHF